MVDRETKLLRLMRDKEWHSSDEMMAAAGHRFSTVVFDLRRKGYEIEGEQRPGSMWRYRMTKTPGDTTPPVSDQGSLFAL